MLQKLLYVALTLYGLIVPINWAEANDYLEPTGNPEGSLDPYNQILRTVFREAFAPNARATVIMVPSFSPERMAAIIHRGSRYEVITATPTVHLWSFEILRMMEGGQIRRIDAQGKAEQAKEINALRRRLPADPRDVSLKRCSRQISPTTASAAIKAWDIMLTDLRPNDEIILDGVSFEFSMPQSGKQGRANTPVSGRARRLADLSSLLDAYCHGRRNESAIRRVAESIQPVEQR